MCDRAELVGRVFLEEVVVCVVLEVFVAVFLFSQGVETGDGF